jgi:formylglycine-generating enzyme required for sulfatase activity
MPWIARFFPRFGEFSGKVWTLRISQAPFPPPANPVLLKATMRVFLPILVPFVALLNSCAPELPPLPTGEGMPVYDQPHRVEFLDMELVWIESLQSWVGKFEVSTNQYTKFKMGHNVKRVAARFGLTAPDQPVVGVSYEDAMDFAEWINERETEAGRLPSGWKYKLPTGDQWEEFATCGHTRWTYPWGKEFPPPHGNIGDKSSATENGLADYNDGFPVSCDVRKAGTNDWGLCGTFGNAAEWVDDWYGQSKTKRVFRGGSWRTMSKRSLETDFRGKNAPTYKGDDIGFRLILTYTAPRP